MAGRGRTGTRGTAGGAKQRNKDRQQENKIRRYSQALHQGVENFKSNYSPNFNPYLEIEDDKLAELEALQNNPLEDEELEALRAAREQPGERPMVTERIVEEPVAIDPMEARRLYYRRAMRNSNIENRVSRMQDRLSDPQFRKAHRNIIPNRLENINRKSFSKKFQEARAKRHG